MTAGDGYISASPVANQTLTLPDCTGQSGAVYTVTNLQSAFTVGVLAGSSTQLINGFAAGTAVPVPSNSSVELPRCSESEECLGLSLGALVMWSVGAASSDGRGCPL